MRVEFYDKDHDNWQGAFIQSAAVKSDQDSEVYNVHGDNLRHPSYPAKCPVCGRRKGDGVDFFGITVAVMIVLTCLAIIAVSVKYIFVR